MVVIVNPMNNTTTSTALTDAAFLTEKEKAFLKICLNYSDLETQLEDNFSNGGIDEAMDLFEGTKQYKRQAAGGLLTSLTKKGMGEFWADNDQFALSDRGVYAAFAA